MNIHKLEENFSVCKIQNISDADFSREFLFLSKTDEEISLVCETDFVPGNATAVENGWKGFRIVGVLDFGMVGVIAKISALLAEAGISVFVVSTYNTDYVFIKEENFERAVELLQNNHPAATRHPSIGGE